MQGGQCQPGDMDMDAAIRLEGAREWKKGSVQVRETAIDIQCVSWEQEQWPRTSSIDFEDPQEEEQKQKSIKNDEMGCEQKSCAIQVINC